MFHFDTELPNTVAFLLLLIMLVGSFYRTATHSYAERAIWLVWSFRNIVWAFMVGLLWWMTAHHARELDPDLGTFWHIYKEHMRVYSAVHVWFGFRYAFKSFGATSEWILTGVPTVCCLISLFVVYYIGG